MNEDRRRNEMMWRRKKIVLAAADWAKENHIDRYVNGMHWANSNGVAAASAPIQATTNDLPLNKQN